MVYMQNCELCCVHLLLGQLLFMRKHCLLSQITAEELFDTRVLNNFPNMTNKVTIHRIYIERTSVLLM